MNKKLMVNLSKNGPKIVSKFNKLLMLQEFYFKI